MRKKQMESEDRVQPEGNRCENAYNIYIYIYYIHISKMGCVLFLLVCLGFFWLQDAISDSLFDDDSLCEVSS